VPDEDDELLRYLAALALVPGQRVELVAAAPFDGPVTLGTGGGQAAISRQLAAEISVSV
jgi:DtxR family Mn-dependent transcriptional regulator